MADCNETLREMHTFLDDELSEPAQRSISGHLEGCVDCLQAYDFHAELKAVIRKKCLADEIPPGLLSRIELWFNEDFDGDGRIG